MKQESSAIIQIINWKEDKIILSYADKYESWEICHSGSNEVMLHIYLQQMANLQYTKQKHLWHKK